MTIRTHKFFLPALLVFQMLFIFTMSSFGHTSSDAQSNLFVDFIAQNFPHVRHGLENNLISLSTLIFLVRKTAHFAEYAILGSLFFLNLKKHSSRPYQTPTRHEYYSQLPLRLYR